MPEYFVEQNTIIRNKRLIATKFNKFFANIGSNLSENVPQSENNYNHYLNAPNRHSFFLDPVTPPDIIKFTNNIKTKNSFDHNNISTKLMKSTINNIVHPLTHIIHLSLSNGIDPESHENSQGNTNIQKWRKNSIYQLSTHQHPTCLL